MNNINTTTISVRVPATVKSEYKDYAEDRKHNPSHFYRMAIYNYMELKEDFEVDKPTERILDNIKRYDYAEMNELFLERENQIISQQIKKATFMRFMDNFLAEIYLKNKQYVMTGEITRDDLRYLMKDAFEELEERAYYHGFETAYESRMEQPFKYARERIANAYDGDIADLDGDIPDLDDDIPDAIQHNK